MTLVLFSDFQCPFCSRVEATMGELREKYGPEKLRIIWKNEPLPFHPYARVAAAAGQGAFEIGGAEAFWRYHQTVFANQRSLSEENVAKWAAEAANVPVDVIQTGLGTGRWASKVEADRTLGDRVGANGTPTSFINGIIVPGAQPAEKFIAAIDAELAAVGSARGVYAERVAANFKPEAQAEDEEPADTAIHQVAVGSSPVRGPKTALVTIVEFADFQCPYCKKVQDAMDDLVARYGGDVRIVWKDEPLSFHPRAKPAAMLAREARAQKGDAGFFAAQKALFAASDLGEASLESIAGSLGLDVALWKQHVAAGAWDAAIEADQDQAGALSASGTPHFFINGRRLVGAQPLDSFVPIVDQEIAKARALVAAGTKPEAVYEELQKNSEPPRVVPPPYEVRTAPAIPTTAPFVGPAKAPVVIQVFSDYQCPFCSRVEPTIEQLLAAYPGKIKLVWRDMPLSFHPYALPAAEAAREAYAQKGNTGYWSFHKVLFQNQTTLERADLLKFAKAEHLDVAKFTAALDTHKHSALITADQSAANKAGVNGTPAFFVNNLFVSGAQPLEVFKKVVDKALKP